MTEQNFYNFISLRHAILCERQLAKSESEPPSTRGREDERALARTKNWRNTKGFTLIEMVITTSIIAILMIVVADFVIGGLRVQSYVSEQNDAVVEARKALQTMVSEIREVVAADTGAYHIEQADANEIIFFSDVDNDDYTERIRYFLNGINLQRGVLEPSGDPLSYNAENEIVTTLATYVRNNASDPMFTFYNEDYPIENTGNPLPAPVDVTQVRLIRLHLYMNVDPNRVPDTREINTVIHLRNLKENF